MTILRSNTNPAARALVKEVLLPEQYRELMRGTFRVQARIYNHWHACLDAYGGFYLQEIRPSVEDRPLNQVYYLCVMAVVRKGRLEDQWNQWTAVPGLDAWLSKYLWLKHDPVGLVLKSNAMFEPLGGLDFRTFLMRLARYHHRENELYERPDAATFQFLRNLTGGRA